MAKSDRFKQLLIILIFLVSLCAFTVKRQVINVTGKGRPAATVSPDYPSFLAISDMHLHAALAQSCGNNDSGDDLWSAAKTKISALLSGSNGSKPKFLIVLGDLPYHSKDDFSDIEQVRKSHDTVYNDLIKLVSISKIPLIIVPGNNDSYDGDYHALNTKHEVNLFLPGVTGEAADQTYADKGFYSAYPMGRKEKFRVIVLNTVIFSATNSGNFAYGPDKQVDATLQLTWLRKQLLDVKAKGESALIAMHIPPGKDGYYKTNPDDTKYMWDTTLRYQGRTLQNAFLDIADSAKNNIVGLLASHTHMDGIRILSKDNTSVSSFLISIPGIAPGHRNNPSIKEISFNPQNKFELEGFTTYYMKYWNGITNCQMSTFDKQFTFQSEFHAATVETMRQTLTGLFKKDKTALYNDVDSIYSVKNGPSASLHTNVPVTVMVGKQ